MCSIFIDVVIELVNFLSDTESKVTFTETGKLTADVFKISNFWHNWAIVETVSVSYFE